MNSPDPRAPLESPVSATGEILVRWRGKQEGPYSGKTIEQKLAAKEIGLLHEVCVNGKWMTLRAYLAEREAFQKAQLLAHEAQARLAREAEERRLREREDSWRAAVLAEEKRKNDLNELAIKSQTIQDPGPSRTPRPGGLPSLQILGALLLLIGGLITVYFFLYFDPSVPSGMGGRIVNLGLMADRQNGVLVGIGVAVVGAIVLVLGNRQLQ